MTDFKNTIGAVRHEIQRHGEHFLLTFQGNDVAKVGPVDDVTEILPDGTIKGPKPLTFGIDLGGEYAL